ncbi:MAG: T9SS type A sorting domain-containing protein, partial [Flavobacteriales bacterium]
DVTGKVVMSRPWVSGGGVDVSALPKGVYTIALLDDSGVKNVSRFCKR